jgi:hypothetical protein
MKEAPPKSSRELGSALQDDALDKARERAKFRAIGQRADYDTFKSMARPRQLRLPTALTQAPQNAQVAVAHLRPLHEQSVRSVGAPACSASLCFAL